MTRSAFLHWGGFLLDNVLVYVEEFSGVSVAIKGNLLARGRHCVLLGVPNERGKSKELEECLVAFIVWGLCGAAGELPPFSSREMRGLELYTLS